MIGEWDIFPKDIRKRGVAVFAFEGGCSVQHLIDQNSQSPPINRTSVPASLDHLGSNILLGSHEGIGSEIGDARLGVDGGQ